MLSYPLAHRARKEFLFYGRFAISPVGLTWARGVEFATVEWIDWYKTKRLLEPIGYVPPRDQATASLQTHAKVSSMDQRPRAEHLRGFALLLLSCLVMASLPTLGVIETTSESDLGACQACEGCENGRCEETSPFDDGDHCCPSTCLAHVVGTLADLHIVPAPSPSRDTASFAGERPVKAIPDAVYQPPRA